MKEVVLVFLSVFMLVSTQDYLPEEPGFIPMNDLYARDVTRSGWIASERLTKINLLFSFHRFL